MNTEFGRNWFIIVGKHSLNNNNLLVFQNQELNTENKWRFNFSHCVMDEPSGDPNRTNRTRLLLFIR